MNAPATSRPPLLLAHSYYLVYDEKQTRKMKPYPPLGTLLHDRRPVSKLIESRPIHTSAIDRMPESQDRYRFFLQLFPWAIQRMDPNGFDLVVSSSHCAAKGVRAPRGVPHVCYCHTPMRYFWDQYDEYFGPGRAAWPVRVAMAAVAAVGRFEQLEFDDDVAASARGFGRARFVEQIRTEVDRVLAAWRARADGTTSRAGRRNPAESRTT